MRNTWPGCAPATPGSASPRHEASLAIAGSRTAHPASMQQRRVGCRPPVSIGSGGHSSVERNGDLPRMTGAVFRALDGLAKVLPQRLLVEEGHTQGGDPQ